jgi:D-sedoheptulose 7-phosphate isomerase
MNPSNLLISKVEILGEILSKVMNDHIVAFNQSAQIVAQAIKNGNTIFWCGNGGSAAESSHLAVELIGRFKNNRKPLASLSLTADSSAITCIANDFGYHEIFARQLEGLGKKGDVLIVLSTSGESENILTALRMAKTLEITTIALLGKNGGRAADLSEVKIVVESEETARIQEVHLLLGHVVCEFVEIELGLN